MNARDPRQSIARRKAAAAAGLASRRRGATLIELVIVIMILGILAAVAAPRMVQWHTRSREAVLLSNLRQVRDAIDRYAAEHDGRLPGQSETEADFVNDLRPYLRRIPTNPMKDGNMVDVQSSGANLVFIGGQPAWRYDTTTGQFVANSNEMSSDGELRYFQW